MIIGNKTYFSPRRYKIFNEYEDRIEYFKLIPYIMKNKNIAYDKAYHRKTGPAIIEDCYFEWAMLGNNSRKDGPTTVVKNARIQYRFLWHRPKSITKTSPFPVSEERYWNT